jgi:uncharacterized SAM-binding protein YcdF (DUF218 family)
MKWWGNLGLAGAAVFFGGWAWHLSGLIERQAVLDEAQPADVIVVLGAAEYRGRPSPVLRARLDHAFDLYRKKLAPRILTTGGAGGDPIYTESEVGRAYLSKLGVPVESIIVENAGESTAQSAVAASEIMRRMNLRSCIVVSDGYHIYRAKQMLTHQGMTAYGSPRHSMAVGTWDYRLLCLREAAGLMLWTMGIRV